MKYKVAAIVIVIILIGGAVWYSRTAKAPEGGTQTPPQGDIIVDLPQPNQMVSSPLQISGKAKGNWFIEATFPVKLLDQNGKVVASGTVRAQGDWQTSDFVNFSGTLSFPMPTSTQGSLQLSKDNPSGLPEHDESFFVPVQFNHATSDRPAGTCAPDAGACNGDAKLCMEENKNVTCN